MTAPPTTPSASASPFWRFSLRLYAAPRVPAACLELQEAAGVDVNVLLFCLFLAKSRRALAADEVRSLIAAVEAWKSAVVVPIRIARVFLRSPPQWAEPDAAAALRQRVKAVELEAERLQQEGLFKMFPAQHQGVSAPDGAAPARANLASLAEALAKRFDPAAIHSILSAYDELGD